MAYSAIKHLAQALLKLNYANKKSTGKHDEEHKI